MGITVDRNDALRVLGEALALAESDADLPDRWIEAVRKIASGPSRTYVPAYGTALLAKATDPGVDPLSIKESYSERAYSLRNLGHGVLVPASRDAERGFDLLASGREPLNNQPFFRYDHMDEVDRIQAQARPVFDFMRDRLREIDELGADEAKIALAAFLRDRQQALRARPQREIGDVEATTRSVLDAVGAFLAPGEDGRPARSQAVVAAMLRLSFPGADVTTAGLHDPSREAPGDVHVRQGSDVVLAAEVRAKLVSQADAEGFVDACSRAGIAAATVVVLGVEDHAPLDREALRNRGLAEGVLVTVLEGESEFLADAFAWNIDRLADIVRAAPGAILAALDVVGASAESEDRWHEAWRSAAPEG